MHKLKVSTAFIDQKKDIFYKNWPQNTWVTKIFNLKNQKMHAISGLSPSGGACLIRAALRSSAISTQLPMTNDVSPLPSGTTRSQVLHRSTALSLCAYPASMIRPTI